MSERPPLLLVMADGEGLPGPTDPRTTLAGLACETSTIRRGTPAQVVDRLGTLSEHGVDRIYLQTVDMTDLDHLDLIAADVLPRLA